MSSLKKMIYAIYKDYRKNHDIDLSYIRLIGALSIDIFIFINAIDLLIFRFGVPWSPLDGNHKVFRILFCFILLFSIHKVMPTRDKLEKVELSKKEFEEGNFYSLIILIAVLVFLFSVMLF